MNGYYRAMERCVPPEGLEVRLEARLQQERRPTGSVIRPWSMMKKAAVAGLVAVMLAVGVGAATLVQWDAIFSAWFGEASAQLAVMEEAFQEVNVTGECDDVALTVRQALGDNTTIYLILDYHLPEAVDRGLVETAWLSQTDSIETVSVRWYGTGDVSWEELKEKDGGRWQETDWADLLEVQRYLDGEKLLKEYRFPGGGSAMTAVQDYDAATGTITYLLRFSTDSNRDLTAQPLTLLVSPPCITVGGERQPLAQQPALITFQPEYTARAKTGKLAEKTPKLVEVSVSPFWITVEYYGSEYQDSAQLRADLQLVLKGGRRVPVSELTRGYGGGYSGSGELRQVTFRSDFRQILDTERVKAIMIGDAKILLKEE